MVSCGCRAASADSNGGHRTCEMAMSSRYVTIFFNPVFGRRAVRFIHSNGYIYSANKNFDETIFSF